MITFIVFSSFLFYNYSVADDTCKLKEISKQTPCKVQYYRVLFVLLFMCMSALSLKIQYIYILYFAFHSRVQYGYFLELHIKRNT